MIKSSQKSQQQQQQAQQERNVLFSQSKSIVWQVKCVVNGIINKKTLNAAQNELHNLAELFGSDFDRYLLKELIEHIDLKDPNKGTKDKSEPFKIQLLNQELTKSQQKPEFLLFFNDIAKHFYGDRFSDFLNELSKRLKLNQTTQLLIALSIADSCYEDTWSEASKLLVLKLQDYYSHGKPEILPEYAIHKLIYFINAHSDLKQDESLKDISNYLIESNLSQINNSVALRSTLSRDIASANSNNEQMSYPLLKESIGLDKLEKSNKMVDLWQILLELGHYVSFNYNHLQQVFKDYQDLKEPQVAKNLLMLAVNSTGVDDQNSKIALAIYDACKKGEKISDKEIGDKKSQQLTWNLDNLGRILRECYSNLNAEKIFEGLTTIKEDIIIDQKAIVFFVNLFNKIKPQNMQFPLHIILNNEWANPLIQIQFIEHTIHLYLDKKDKSIGFNRIPEKLETFDEIQGMKEKNQDLLQVWSTIPLVQRLIHLSHSHHFQRVRSIFEYPIRNCPEYLILTLSRAKPIKGNLMIDELLSILLPQFLGNNINSIPVLQALWKTNQALMIRGICELCRHDQRVMNLSRVLDITQEVKESLLPIVECEDYFFAVNLGILAGKRDFLHYDVWLSRRILQIGTPFIRALLKYIKDHIINPIYEHRKNNEEEASFESFKNQVLDRSHLSKEKLVITLEHLQSTINANNSNVQQSTIEQIRDIIVKTTKLFPTFTMANQSSEEIDNEANNYFQKVFSAEGDQVDSKIIELIETMHKFKVSSVKKEQEVYACMLHSLFDEYRFLHRYPPPYLDKIAKVFGAIIKHKIIEGTLQEIALKFVIEALRREGKRQRFGIITMKQFIDMLPQFPQFFKEIYDIKATIQKNEPQMAVEIEKLWEKVKIEQEKELKASESARDTIRENEKKSEAIMEAKSGRKHNEKLEQPNMPKFNESDFQQNLQTISQGADSSRQAQAPGPMGEGAPIFDPRSKPFTPSQIRGVQNVGDSSSLSRTPAQLQNVQPFIPPKGRGVSQVTQQQPTTQQQQMQEGMGTGLNVKSQAFQKIPASNTPLNQIGRQQSPAPVQIPGQTSNFNANASNFRPQQQTQQQQQQQQVQPIQSLKMIQNTTLSPELQKWKDIIEERLAKAKANKTFLLLDDVIGDEQDQAPPVEVQDVIRITINNTGKQNFHQKLQELKDVINPGGLQYLNWFLNHILVKRQIGQIQPTLQHIYVQIIRQVGMTDSVSLTVQKSVELFKRCLMINEEEYSKVTRQNTQAPNPIKQYLCNLGSFTGQLTLNYNRPLYQREINFKQLLIEAFEGEKLRLVLTFVCRVIKENKTTQIFKVTNPWIKSILSLLREIYEYIENDRSKTDMAQEIESTFISFQASLKDFQPSRILKAIQTQQYGQFLNQYQQFEVKHILQRVSTDPQYPCITPARVEEAPSVQETVQQQQQLPQAPVVNPNASQVPPQNQQQQIQQKVAIHPEIMAKLKSIFNLADRKVRELVGEAVDSSIVEILPPVVDRSVTIALITTRELVIKDFAFDGDPRRILSAADLIVQNLAGSLALVTCREPLKMSLTTNLKKSLTNLSMQLRIVPQQDQIDNHLQEIAATISKENLELGCNMIRDAVIARALTKVREDTALSRAIEKREQFQKSGETQFRDDAVIQYFSDLPQQLRPSPDGLNDSQFQVYEDFAKLNLAPKIPPMVPGLLQQDPNMPNQVEGSIPPVQPQVAREQQATNADRIDKIIEQIESQQLQISEQMKKAISERVAAIMSDNIPIEKERLIQYMCKWFVIMCKKYAQNRMNEFETLLVLIQLILVNYQFPEAYKKVTQQFFQMSDEVYKNIELNIILLKNAIIHSSEWDIQMAGLIIKSNEQQQTENTKYLTHMINEIVNTHMILQIDQIQNTLKAINMQGGSGNESGSFKELFLKWVQISLKEQGVDQREEINQYFQELEVRGFYRDGEQFYKFLKVMMETSVEKALYSDNGEPRSNERIDYRYIESFFKLVIVLLKTSDFNKHEFMSKVFEVILEVLDNDHKNSKQRFNQKPYYRMLLNILNAININTFFNVKTNFLVQLSLGELFSKLNPNKYPGFAFAWLELISHKHFMPLFLKQIPIPNAQMHPSQLQANITQEHSLMQKKQIFKDLIVQLFYFLKNIMIPGLEQQSHSLKKFYEGSIRVALVIFKDYPDFFAEFHFTFVTSLPEHLLQLRNIILSSYPQNIIPPNPFNKALKVDLLVEMKEQPRILSNFENYLHIQNLKEDLENYFRNKSPALIDTICQKLSEFEVVNARRKKNAKVIGAVVLFIAAHVNNVQKQLQQKESMEMFKQIIMKLDETTRLVLLNAIVNELRYPNSHTYYFSCVILYLFTEQSNISIQEQIARPHPWGLMISFRELIQNPKYGFMKKPFIAQNQVAIEKLFEERLKNYSGFNTANRQGQGPSGQMNTQ